MYVLNIEQDMTYIQNHEQKSYTLYIVSHISVSIFVSNQVIAPIHSSANHANHLHWMQIVMRQTAQFGSKAANMLIIGAQQAKCPKTARRHS